MPTGIDATRQRIKKALIRLAIIAPVLAIFITFVIVPRLPWVRIGRNEAAAILSLKIIASQQAIFKQACEVNQDEDFTEFTGRFRGGAEYGFLAELSAELTPRKPPGYPSYSPVGPPFISRAFNTGGSRGRGFAETGGYCFQVWLPGPEGPMNDTACDGTPTERASRLDPRHHGDIIDLQEEHFIVYAWPIRYGKTGRKTFAINEIGDVFSTEANYSGTDRMPKPNAVFQKGQPVFTGQFGNGEGNDGNVWVPAG